MNVCLLLLLLFSERLFLHNSCDKKGNNYFDDFIVFLQVVFEFLREERIR